MVLFIFVFGLIVGSFLNVCIYRIPIEIGISFPPSHCPVCQERIKWYDLFPVISYILLRGKCRKCGEIISIEYPIVELIVGITYSLLYIKFGLTITLVKFIILFGFIIVIAMIDFKTTYVYFKTTLMGSIFGLVFIIINYYQGQEIIGYVYGALLSGGILALIVIVTKGMGWGDVEIGFLCGFYLGFKLTCVMLFLAFVTGGLIGLLLIILKLKTRKDTMPFGPFIAFSTVLTVFFGEWLLTSYLLL